MRIDIERIEKYIDEIAAETIDLENVLAHPDEVILQDPHILKSLKYSTIVIAEATAGTLQHILAKRHNAVVDDHIGMSGKIYHVTEILIWALFLISIMWFIVAFGGFVARAIVASPRVDPRGIYAGLIKVVCYLIALAIAGIILFKGLSEFGISLVPLITGLGVGGLAVALAARPTIENLIGGLMILADRPYKVGQRIKVKDKDGIVQQIGMRSTKIRMLSGPQLSVPNEEMARAEIENVSRRQNIRRNANITLKIDTPPEKVEKAVDIIRDILADHEGMDRVHPLFLTDIARHGI